MQDIAVGFFPESCIRANPHGVRAFDAPRAKNTDRKK
jgi:hypothetical protein